MVALGRFGTGLVTGLSRAAPKGVRTFATTAALPQQLISASPRSPRTLHIPEAGHVLNALEAIRSRTYSSNAAVTVAQKKAAAEQAKQNRQKLLQHRDYPTAQATRTVGSLKARLAAEAAAERALADEGSSAILGNAAGAHLFLPSGHPISAQLRRRPVGEGMVAVIPPGVIPGLVNWLRSARAGSGAAGEHILNVYHFLQATIEGFVHNVGPVSDPLTTYTRDDCLRVLDIIPTLCNAVVNRIPISTQANSALERLMSIVRNTGVNLTQAWNELEDTDKDIIRAYQRQVASYAYPAVRQIAPLRLAEGEPNGGVQTLINHRQAVLNHYNNNFETIIQNLSPAGKELARSIFDRFKAMNNKVDGVLMGGGQPLTNPYESRYDSIVNNIFRNSANIISSTESHAANKTITTEEAYNDIMSIVSAIQETAKAEPQMLPPVSPMVVNRRALPVSPMVTGLQGGKTRRYRARRQTRRLHKSRGTMKRKQKKTRRQK